MPRDQRTTTGQDPVTSDDPLFRAPDDQRGDQPLGGHGDPLRDPLDADGDRTDTPIGDGIATGRHAGDEPSDTPGEWVAGNRGPGYAADRDGSVVPGQPGEPALERTDLDGDTKTSDRDPVTADPAATGPASDLRTTSDPEVAPDSTFTRGAGAPVDPNAPAPTTEPAGATSLSAATADSDGSATTADSAASDSAATEPGASGTTVAPETTAVPETAADSAATTAATTTPDPAAGAPVPGAPGTGSTTGVQAASAPLVSHGAELRDNWARIQSSFVDDPRGSVSQAADLVSQVTSSLVTALQEREQTLRGSWESRGDQGPDTENLRNALRDYRAFFEMLTKV